MEVAVGTGMELVGARAGLVVEVAVGARKITPPPVIKAIPRGH